MNVVKLTMKEKLFYKNSRKKTEKRIERNIKKRSSITIEGVKTL
jgi:hypothetical protein